MSKNKRNLKKTIIKRYKFLITLVLISMLILIGNLLYIQIFKYDYYNDKLKYLSTNIVYSESLPRGKIYDTKGKVIVDNKEVSEIIYRKLRGITTSKEIEISEELSKILDVNYNSLTKNELKEFWIVNNKEESDKLIKDEEYELLDRRKITKDDIKKLKLERIDDDKLSNLNEEAAYIYYLMNKGYYNDTKVIKRYASNEEVEKINNSSLMGININISWDRVYPYGETLKTILGSVSKIPVELKDYYLDKGLDLDDRVGISYLEYQYDDVLRGTKDKYKVELDGTLTLLEEGKKGNDIVLTIDIELQKEIEKIIEEEIKYSITNEKMIYYNKSYAIITEPHTGSILTMAGVEVVKKGDEFKTYDYGAGIVTSPVVVGSAIKGASHIVGYNNNALKIGEYRTDECVKISSTPEKCSWKEYGRIDDIGALKYSSNVYQYKTAMKVGKANYKYNTPLIIDESAFDIYRNIYKMFGLGTKTGIDLPIESMGYIGTSRLPGLLLDLSIGQYDNYTPIMLSQYIDTIANNGIRIKKHLIKEIYDGSKEDNNIIYSYEVEEMNKVETEEIYMNRVKLGLQEVMSAGGTGYGYIDRIYNPAGKTGTSESFIDTDNDGLVDTETLSNTFVGYAPADNPKVTFTIISPDIGYYKGNKTIRSYVNKRISCQVAKKYFDFYK